MAAPASSVATFEKLHVYVPIAALGAIFGENRRDIKRWYHVASCTIIIRLPCEHDITQIVKASISDRTKMMPSLILMHQSHVADLLRTVTATNEAAQSSTSYNDAHAAIVTQCHIPDGVWLEIESTSVAHIRSDLIINVYRWFTGAGIHTHDTIIWGNHLLDMNDDPAFAALNNHMADVLNVFISIMPAWSTIASSHDENPIDGWAAIKM